MKTIVYLFLLTQFFFCSCKTEKEIFNPEKKFSSELLKKDYRLTDTTEIRKFKGSPIDKVEQIVQGKYPILILCADADEAVPPEENTLLFEQRLKEKHGDITVMHKPGFKHHPHSLPNPTPIVEFVLKASGLLVVE